jgi:hypothetical protein
MPYTAEAKDLMLNALKGTNPTTPITHVGLQTAGAEITSVSSSDALTFDKTSHGLSAGDMVILTEKTGGSALVAGDAANANEGARVYFVIATGLTANAFRVSTIPGGTAEAHGSNVTSTKVIKLTELSGGSYARVSIAYNTAVGGTMDDSTNGAVINVPAAGVVNYVSYHSASTSGKVLAIDKVTQESFGAAGTYTLTDSDLDLNQGA